MCNLRSPRPHIHIARPVVYCVEGDAERLRRGESLVQFDALLLYDESDADFAAEIVSRMENRGLLVSWCSSVLKY